MESRKSPGRMNWQGQVTNSGGSLFPQGSEKGDVPRVPFSILGALGADPRQAR